MSELLRARDVCVTIDGVEILRGADLDLKAGELVAIVGPNGAGQVDAGARGLRPPPPERRDGRLVGP